MILKLLIIAIVGVMVYRFFGGRVPILDGVKKSRSKPTKREREAVMVECSECGTYVMVDEATLSSGSYYCNECV